MKAPVLSITTAILMQASIADAQVAAGKPFDGVWASTANVTLIKEMKGYLILQGKDPESTWSARCVKKGMSATCRGNGVRNEGEQFVFESTLVLKAGTIEDAWKATFPENQVVEGKDTLKPVPIPGAQR